MHAASPPDGARAHLWHSMLEVARSAHTQIDGADGAGVTVLLGSGPVYAGSNRFTQAIDEVQYGLGQGPCLTAAASRTTVRSATIGTTERRWPRFTHEASALELRSVLSVPLLAGDELIGSLNLYSRHARGLNTIGSTTLQRATRTAGSTLLSDRLLALVEDAAQVAGSALQDRTDTDLAVGVLMDRYSYTAAEAAILLAQLGRLDGVSTAAAARDLTHAGER